jgi:hypothetical protein
MVAANGTGAEPPKAVVAILDKNGTSGTRAQMSSRKPQKANHL